MGIYFNKAFSEGFISKSKERYKEIKDKLNETKDIPFDRREDFICSFDKDTLKKINSCYKNIDTKKVKFIVRSYYSLVKYDIADMPGEDDFKMTESDLLKIVNKCSSIDDINYLKQDLKVIKITLNYAIKNNNIDTLKDYKKWIETTYIKAINNKEKEIRN